MEYILNNCSEIQGSLEDELHDEPGQGLDEEEEEYDALNDETFGTEAVEGDWEEDHEKLAEIAEQSRLRRNSYNNDNHIESDDHADLELEASISQLVLDDFDDPISENGENTKTNTITSRHFPSTSTGVDLIESPSYSSSAPSGYSVWGIAKTDIQQKSTQPVLAGGKNVCTVEEVERDLILQRTTAPIAPPPGISKPSLALHLEDVERDLATSTASNYSVIPLGLGRGQPQPNPFAHQDVVVMRNTQNSAGVGTIGRGGAYFPSHLPGPTPQSVLGLGRGSTGSAAFGQVVLPSRIHGPHPPPIAIPDLRQLQQQNHRLIGSAPNLLRFIPPTLMMQSQQPLRDGTKTLGHQGFATENGILRSLHPHRNNMGYRPGFQGSLVDQHRMGVASQFSLRPERMMGSHFINNRASSGNFGQHHGHRGNYNSHYNNHSNYRQQNGSGDYDEYAGLMTSREKQWLLNIQLLQLNTSQPYIDDYYYTVFSSRQPKKNNKKIEMHDSFGHRERRDSHKDQRNDQQQGTSRVYTPAQFENSLGKLQVGSVTAPRKIIDMDVVSPEGLDSTLQSLQRDSRKAKQLLLEIERLYLLLLQVEDSTSSVPEVKESVTEDKSDLLHKIVTSLLVEDKLTSFMCVHKGKLLLLRVLPHLLAESEDEGSHLVQIWSTIFRSIVTIIKRDQASDESLLPRFYPHLKTWLSRAKFPSLLEVAHSLSPGSRDSSRNTSPITPVPPAKNALVYALGNKFGISSLAVMMEHGERLYPTLEEKQCNEWTSFITSLVEALGSVPSTSSLPTPIEPMDAVLLNQHLGRCSSLHIEKYAVLERVFTGPQKVEVENKENKAHS
ncbi:protein PAT1 homolog 1 isoform X2 [Periplaneta americana]|uniref:protein PAT1 homolog 1 isoform X2 n=1 Tax=Periplaneta americana TaxID=6978 RepID=UPI0037E83272